MTRTLSRGRELVAIPGPSVIPDRVLSAMHRAMPNIYEGELIEASDSVFRDLPAIARQLGIAAKHARDSGIGDESSLRARRAKTHHSKAESALRASNVRLGSIRRAMGFRLAKDTHRMVFRLHSMPVRSQGGART